MSQLEQQQHLTNICCLQQGERSLLLRLAELYSSCSDRILQCKSEAHASINSLAG
ncbi:MAG: hypothetical protein AAF268_01080 [Cyanobacteria bacterium P01_A01_bin.3]